MELFKNLYNDQFFGFFTQAMGEVYPNFQVAIFMEAIYDEAWEQRELKQRMRHITECLKKQLPEAFEESAQLILDCIAQLKKNGLKEHSVEYMFFPDYIECYGLEEREVACRAMEEITQFTSCEFAVRPFIIRYPEAMLAQMLVWSKHDNLHVRRLATEGSRPRLPWAMALPALKKDPSPILPILENLKADESEYVHRSVANNLNDIAKDHPELVIDTAKRWIGKSAETDWVVKHASRTLLKQGNAELMQLFGFGSIDEIRLTDFLVHTPRVVLGQELLFSFNLENTAKRAAKIRLEYGVYYQKANGSLSKKVFKISEKEYAAQSTTSIERKQHFKSITTRVYHAGKHEVSLIVNGVELEKREFMFTF
ncbi:MAG TPA: DNA alkylation repair protein [Cytophagales bacterium]|nr:DNA alkylation repair protein [Cytophagales bacterium]HAA21565.1 DNA alkylation repair protein [Cytophagales bacterium]HAP59040.1 DNA alkylation repair protein [Cytophagales bacterium]